MAVTQSVFVPLVLSRWVRHDGPMAFPPTGTVTFLFTDVERSTRWWDEHPDAMDAALSVHDAIVRERVDAHAGFLFSTGGDGFAIAFSSAHRRDLAEQARAHLDAAQIDEARAAAQLLDVRTILDREVRSVPGRSS
jgi:class 3 adenylate cyclase